MRRSLQCAALLLAASLQQGCDLSTSPPTGVVLPGVLDGRDGLPVRLARAIGDFAVAYGGDHPEDGFILVSGLLADELRQNILSSPNVSLDRRAALLSNALSALVYVDLQRARASAEDAVDAYRTFDPSAVGSLYARNLAGFAYALLGEGFCGGIPFSRAAPDGAVTYGSAETTTQVLERALAAFDSVLAASPSVLAAHETAADSVAAQVNLALVGRARALLDLRRYPDAGADAARVPDGFGWKLDYSDNSPREENGIYYHIVTNPEYDPADSEGVNGIAFLAAGDPRAQVVPASGAPVEYDFASAPAVLAGTTEARLIEAEARLQSGDASGSLALLNALRAPLGVAPLGDAGTPQGRVTQLFRERAFWLWLTGHRLGDLRRLVRQYQRPSTAVYPVGPYPDGPSLYGTQLALGVYEVNNPRYDPAACDPSQP